MNLGLNYPKDKEPMSDLELRIKETQDLVRVPHGQLGVYSLPADHDLILQILFNQQTIMETLDRLDKLPALKTPPEYPEG